ncbi:hypothetical protein OAO41_00855 [Euryarchaeota archaeon]|nr:hypothetical protein [Euryarchaeota archaeon]
MYYLLIKVINQISFPENVSMDKSEEITTKVVVDNDEVSISNLIQLLSLEIAKGTEENDSYKGGITQQDIEAFKQEFSSSQRFDLHLIRSWIKTLKQHQNKESEVSRREYFNNNYESSLGKLYELPEKEPEKSWYDWHIHEGHKLGYQLEDLMHLKSDLRILRPKNDYLFKVALQSRVEKMAEGNSSIKILDGDVRRREQSQSDDTSRKLITSFSKSFNNVFSNKMDKYVVHSNGTSNTYCNLSIKTIEEIIQTSDEEGLFEKISKVCVRLLIKESREKERKSRWDRKMKKKTEGYTKYTDICLIEKNFIIGLSEYIEDKLNKGFQNKKESLQEDGRWIGLINADQIKLNNTFLRASRIFSQLIIAALNSEGWIQRRAGTYNDFLLHLPVDDDDKESKNKVSGQHRNMMSFSDKLKKEVAPCELRDFKTREENAIFRVLRNDTHRYMYCCPSDHKISPEKTSGGYINTDSKSGSSVGLTVTKEKKISKITNKSSLFSCSKKRFEYNNESLRALNILQKTQWEINYDLLQFISLSIDTELQGTSYADIQLKEIFRKSFYYDEEIENIRDRDRRRFENIERRKRLTYIGRILSHNANVFWHSWAFDWRGRLIARAPILSPQKSDIDRSLIRFKEWKELGINGWKWFRIFLFNFCKEDPYWLDDQPSKSFSKDEKCKWIDRNKLRIKSLINNIDDPKVIAYLDLNKSPMPKSETFQRISVLLEYKRILDEYNDKKDWSKVTSGHPIHFDASSNGYQHLSLLINNKQLAKKVNVLPNEVKNDIYQEVADQAIENWDNNQSKLKKYLLENFNELDNEQLNSIKNSVFNRNLAKLPTMTSIYGAKDYESCFIGSNGKGKPKFIKSGKVWVCCWHEDSPIYQNLSKLNNIKFLGPNGYFSEDKFVSPDKKVLRQNIFVENLITDYKKSIEEVTGGAYEQLTQKLKKLVNKGKKPDISWKLDDGSQIWHYYPAKQVVTNYDSTSSLKLLIDTDALNFSPKNRVDILHKLNELSHIYPMCKIDDKFIEEAIMNYNKWVGNDEDFFGKKIVELNNNLYIGEPTSSKSKLPWKILSLRSEDIISLKEVDIKLEKIYKKIGNTKKPVKNEKKKKEKKILLKKLVNEQRKLKEEKKELEKLIDEEQTDSEKAELEFQRSNEIHNYWAAIYYLFKMYPKSSSQDLLRAIEQHMIRKLEDSDDEFIKACKMAFNISTKCNFIDYDGRADKRRILSGISPNFIHSLDAYHMRSSIIKFSESVKNPSIWAVHDSFGTHACDIGSYIEVIKEMFLGMHKEKDLNKWCEEISKENGIEVKEDSIGDPDFRNELINGEIQISDFFLS